MSLFLTHRGAFAIDHGRLIGQHTDATQALPNLVRLAALIRTQKAHLDILLQLSVYVDSIHPDIAVSLVGPLLVTDRAGY